MKPLVVLNKSKDWKSIKLHLKSLSNKQKGDAFKREDFKDEHGINVISINSNHDKKLKSKAAERLIPVHPEL